MTKMAEVMDHRDFRERTRDDYNNRRAEGRLGVYPKSFHFYALNFVYDGNLGICALAPAQLTCATLDEQMGKSVSLFFYSLIVLHCQNSLLDCEKFNVLWLNPYNPNTFPRGLLDALYNSDKLTTIVNDTGESVQSRLRKQMQADSLQPIDDEELTTNAKSLIPAEDQYGSEVLEEATQFLRLQV
jgi:hypothetical protein